jgi:glycogen phosphorylase
MNDTVSAIKALDANLTIHILRDLRTEIQRHLEFTLGFHGRSVDQEYLYRALAFAVRDRLVANWRRTNQRLIEADCKRTYYLSLEFLIGRSLGNAVQNLDLEQDAEKALHDFSARLEQIEEQELDAGLGNGGLGRLAACFLDSCANLGLPVTGYGIRYEYGMFNQKIQDGRQIEQPDHWLRDGNPWEFERVEDSIRVPFYGRVEQLCYTEGGCHARWVETRDVLAIPFDMPIPGHANETVNTLRLWKATATDAFNFGEFNSGGYTEAVAAKNNAEQITMVLYPNDASESGKELRLKQQYFLVSATLQDVLRQWVARNGNDFSKFSEKNCFQLNDTHPALAVAELMRLLIDVHRIGWDEAWKITTASMAYTNHTLLPEALERWSVRMFSQLLPRPLEIIYEINRRFLAEVSQRWPGDVSKLQAMSIIEEGDNPHIRMAYLAIVGSFSVNGVAKLHTELLVNGLFSDFYALTPKKFNNKTNGVTPRRWLAYCNPKLRDLINEAIGTQWQNDLSQIAMLLPLAEDSQFRKRWGQIKLENKIRLAQYVAENTGVSFEINSIFDVQVKRIHEYKRQLLNVLHVIHLYDRIKRGETVGMVPRCVLIGGKAAPGYHIAKLIIKLVNNVAAVINQDGEVSPWLKLVFFPNYRVSAMEVICPGTELSEQISTAGKEASGTGNMKFMMNGALTIGTLDGANIEIREQVGDDNFFLFGLNASQVAETKMNYQPNDIIARDEAIGRVMQLLEGGHFNRNEPGVFDILTAGLRNRYDQWLTIADLRSYIDVQKRVCQAYQNQDHWNRMSILNTGSSSKFSSDRTINEYAKEIWKIGCLEQ